MLFGGGYVFVCVVVVDFEFCEGEYDVIGLVIVCFFDDVCIC